MKRIFLSAFLSPSSELSNVGVKCFSVDFLESFSSEY